MDPTTPLQPVQTGATPEPRFEPVPADSAQPEASPWLYRYSVFLVIFTLLHVKIGANVTSTGSGLAFEDWPLSNGYLWPPDMDLPGLFEHGHRTSGTIVGILVLALTIWVGIRDRRSWLRKVAIWTLGCTALVGVLGGWGVQLGLPSATSIAHGVLAQVIVCLLALIAFALSPAWNVQVEVPPDQAQTGRRLATISLGLVFAQLFVGAVLRHTNATGMMWLHVFNALVVAIAIMVAAMYCGTRFRKAGFAGLGRWVLIVLVLQLLLGFATLAVRRVKDPSNVEYLGRSLIVTTHVVTGALLFLAAALLTYRAFRNLVPDPSLEPGTRG